MENKWIWAAAVVCMAGVQAPSVAEACGAIIPVDGETASLDAQRVTMAYFPEEERTRVMAQIGYVGDLTNFSWIIPLPSEPSEVEAVDQAGAAIFADIDTISEPEFVITDWTCALNNGGGERPVAGVGVEVLQHGNTGSFDYVVLTGESGTGVTQWLDENGYALPNGMDETIHTYIREGSVFMAMKVDIEALELGQIDPAIRFDYQGHPGYPLRILRPTTSDEVEIILNVLAPTPAQIPGEVRLWDDDISWSDGEPLYLDALRAAGNWVVESRGTMRARWVGDFETGRDVEPPKELMEEVLGIPAETEFVLSRFHGIFDADALADDTAIQMIADAPSIYSYFAKDVEDTDVDCWDGDDDWYEEDEGDNTPSDEDLQGEQDGELGPKRAAGGCSTTSGAGPAAPALFALLMGWAVRRRNRGAEVGR